MIKKLMQSELSWLIGIAMTIGSVVWSNVNTTSTIVNQVNLVSQKLEAHITEDTKQSDKFDETLSAVNKAIMSVKENVAVINNILGYKNKDSNNS